MLDADILIGALDGSDPHHTRARQMLTSWHALDDPILISVVNLTEVLIAPATDHERVRAARAAIAALGVGIHRPTEAIAVDAARLRARYPISLPDSYLLATTRHLGATAASFDHKIRRSANAEGIQTTSRS